MYVSIELARKRCENVLEIWRIFFFFRLYLLEELDYLFKINLSEIIKKGRLLNSSFFCKLIHSLTEVDFPIYKFVAFFSTSTTKREIFLVLWH